MKTMNPNEMKYSLTGEQYEEYQKLLSDEKQRLKKGLDDYNSFHVDVPEGVLSNVPETKQREILDKAKLELIQIRMSMAKDEIVRANSPLKAQEISKLLVDYHNMRRQLIWNQTRLKALNKGDSVKDRDDKAVYSWELQYLIDKITVDLGFVVKDLKFLGVDVEKDSMNNKVVMEQQQRHYYENRL